MALQDVESETHDGEAGRARGFLFSVTAVWVACGSALYRCDALDGHACDERYLTPRNDILRGRRTERSSLTGR
jgi:hypothetical protein